MNQTFLKLMTLTVAIFCYTQAFSQQQCLKNAWNAYNAGNYESAITYCDQCIEDFGKKAERMQKELESQGRKNSDFPTGAVSDAMKAKTFKNWAINDVSTACFIKGKSAEYIYKKSKSKNKSYQQKATEAYNQACKYSFGRCWDTAGWFWSPCAESNDRFPVD